MLENPNKWSKETSWSNDSNIEKAQSLKANAFITKSNPAEIEDALREALEM